MPADMRRLAVALLFTTSAAHAGAFDFPGTRATGMGGAMRGAATGDAAPMLNPSGMSLRPAYVIEGAYQYVNPAGENAYRASIVDSTSAFHIAGGLYYTYRDGASAKGHEGGLSLAFPLGERIFFGGTGKYLRLEEGPASIREFTFDVGATVKPIPMLGIGVVGYNLRDSQTPRAPRGVGGGVAVNPADTVLLVADTLIEFPGVADTRERLVSVMGGGELLLGKAFAARAGGGRDGRTDHGYVTGGLSAVAEVGAVDVAVRQDVTGRDKLLVFTASVRLFVPAP